MRYKIPELRLRAIELGFDFNELSAACLHIAHCEARSKGIQVSKKITIPGIIYLLIFFKLSKAQIYELYPS